MPVEVAEQHASRKYGLFAERLGVRQPHCAVVPAAEDRAELLRMPRLSAERREVRRRVQHLERIVVLDVPAARIEPRDALAKRLPPQHRNARTRRLELLPGIPRHHRAPVVSHRLRPCGHRILVDLLLLVPHLVAAEMDERHLLRRRERAQLGDQAAQRLLHAGILHRLESERMPERLGMPRHVELGHDRHAARKCVIDDIAELLLRIALPVVAVAERIVIALLRYLRIALRRKPPPVVFGDVPVEQVQLVRRHHVDHVLERRHVQVVPPGIEHEAAPLQDRPVHDPAAWRMSAAELHELSKRLLRVQLAGTPCRRHSSAVTRDLEHIRLVRNGLRRARHVAAHDLQVCRRRWVEMALQRLRFARLRNQFVKRRRRERCRRKCRKCQCCSDFHCRIPFVC